MKVFEMLEDSIKGILRMRLGLEKNDTSKDNQLKKLNKQQIVKEIMTWEFGDPYFWDNLIYKISKVSGKDEDDINNYLFK